MNVLNMTGFGVYKLLARLCKAVTRRRVIFCLLVYVEYSVLELQVSLCTH